MKKIILLNWTDNTAQELTKKIEIIGISVDKEDKKFQKDINKIQADNNISISTDFNPEGYRP